MLSLSLSRSFGWFPAAQPIKGCVSLVFCVVSEICLHLLNSSADSLEQFFLFGSVVQCVVLRSSGESYGSFWKTSGSAAHLEEQ